MESIPIEDDGYHIVLQAHINGKKARMLIDTGASKTVFDIHRIKKFLPESVKDSGFSLMPQSAIGLGTNDIKSHITNVKKFRLGKIVFENFPAILLDLQNINQSYQMLKIKPIDGVIGSDLLMLLRAQISFRKMTLKIYLPEQVLKIQARK